MKIAGHQSRLYCKWDDVDALFYFGKFVVAACNKVCITYIIYHKLLISHEAGFWLRKVR